MTISEPEFRERLALKLAGTNLSGVAFVTGPGRSGALAAVYASHMLGVPFVPYGERGPSDKGRALLVDTARKSGRTLRKAEGRYRHAEPIVVVAYEEPPRVTFWYEFEREAR